MLVGQRSPGRRPFDKLGLVEQCKKTRGMFRTARAKLNALRRPETAPRRALKRAVMPKGRVSAQGALRSPWFHRPDFCLADGGAGGYSAAALVKMGSRGNDGDTTMKTKHDWSRLDAMTEEQRRAAALADPDAQPLSDVDMDRMRLTPRLKIIRRALGLTQEEFAA
jgi:hypothetical protein